MSKLKEFYQENRLPLRFVLIFCLWIIAAHAIIFLLQLTSFIPALNQLTATLTRFTLNLFGATVIQSKEILVWGIFSLKVITECTGLFLFIVYVAAVLSYPTTGEKKAWGLIGLPFLVALNILRLDILMVVGRYYPGVFHFVHLYLWQTTFIIVVIGVWIIWLELVVRSEG